MFILTQDDHRSNMEIHPRFEGTLVSYISLAIGAIDTVDKVRLSLESSSSYWFTWVKYAGYAVAIGCALEAPETFVVIRRWTAIRFRDEEQDETREEKRSWIVPLAAVGLLIIVMGIVVETFAEGKVSDFDALLRAHESDQLSAAEREAAEAIRDAGTARDSAVASARAASGSNLSSKKASGAAIQAISASENAVTTASGARKEADSFEKDISSSKQLAADAESHLADALQRAANAEERMRQLQSPRSLIDADSLDSVLKPFKGTEYTFVGCFQDQDSIELSRQLNKALLKAGWTKVDADTTQNGFDLHLNVEADFKTPITNLSGIYVVVQSRQDVKSLQSVPFSQLPIYFRAAGALKGALISGVSPRQADLDSPLTVDPGDSKRVLIVIGSKKL
jgi:hypothetical protein